MPHILFGGRTFRPFEYELEADFERAVVDHCTDIFGAETVYFDIKKRLGNQNVLTIPDGYLIDFSFPRSPRLYIIENELVKHDPYRHIGQQLLKFAIAYKTSGRKLKRVLYEEIQADPERRAFVEQRSEEAGYRNVDVLLEEIIFDHPVSAIVVIDEVTSDLENVLGQLTMNTDVVELRTFTHDDDVIHHVTPFQQDVRDAATSEGRDTSPEDLDTIVVPARQEGFEEVFLGEDCWYAIRISSSMIDRIKYIAGYQTAPISAVTHYAEVASIEKYEDTGKHIVHFKGPAREIGPIPLPDESAGVVPYSHRYTRFDTLQEAQTLGDVF
jgi:hypothetical protein